MTLIWASNAPRASDRQALDLFPRKEIPLLPGWLPYEFLQTHDAARMQFDVCGDRLSPDETFAMTSAKAMKDAIRGLLDCGLLESEEEIITRNILRIPVAYVTYDKNRTPLTAQILNFLESKHVYSIGRFGGWKYSYMEEAILEGKSAAEKILGN